MKHLRQGEKIKLLPPDQLMKVLQNRNFCSNDETRQRVANSIGGKWGIVESIEDKYAFDYFFFLPIGEIINYSIPYGSVDFASEERKYSREEVVALIGNALFAVGSGIEIQAYPDGTTESFDADNWIKENLR